MGNNFLGSSSVRCDDGKLKVMFRGDYRADTIANGFKIIEMEDGGSGGLYFTDNPVIASSYANNKPYYEDGATDAWRWIDVTIKSYGKERVVPLAKANVWLNKEQKKNLRDVITRLSDTSDGLKATGEDPVISERTFDDFLVRNKNNHIATMIDLLHSSGMMFEAEEFLDFVKECGVFEGVEYTDPFRQEAVVTPVYLDIKNPLPTHNYPDGFFDEVREIIGSKDATLQALESSASMNLMETVTFITPEFRGALLKLGYDGIIDIGGRNTDTDPHTVYIAFSTEQIVPAYCKEAVEYRNAVEHELQPMSF